jgi:hypothetical protein
MPTASHTNVLQYLQELAKDAGLTVTESGHGTDFTGAPTAKLRVSAGSGNDHSLEITEAFASVLEKKPELQQELKSYLEILAKRLQTARPDVFVTISGLPLAMEQFSWPYHRSTSGADSYILHGVARLAEPESPLHAKVSASLTVTFAEVLPALEQPYAEGVTFNAIRKTLDLGQLELIKSGNRQPVPVSTRYFSFRQKRFIFNETTEAQRQTFLRSKIFWISAKLGDRRPAWIADPFDAQYLDCSVDELRKIAASLVQEGEINLDDSGEYATATDKLAQHSETFHEKMRTALSLLKPKFNDEMRAGHTNM